jgi:hypothetical protein
MRDVITEYYQSVNDHDWGKLASTLSPDVIRMGILSDVRDDTAVGRDPYVKFVSSLIDTFPVHKMEIIGLFYSADRRLACAETLETTQTEGGPLVQYHCLKWHEINEDGLISKISQFRKAAPSATSDSISVSFVNAKIEPKD